VEVTQIQLHVSKCKTDKLKGGKKKKTTISVVRKKFSLGNGTFDGLAELLSQRNPPLSSFSITPPFLFFSALFISLFFSIVAFLSYLTLQNSGMEPFLHCYLLLDSG
jgi:hypothetical protein